MNPRLRLTLFLAAGVALGITIGVEIADESYGFSSLILVAAGWLMIKRSSKAVPEAWLLSVLLVGYIVGNRGFAQLQPARNIPLLPAEAVLLVGIPGLLFRMALKQSRGVQRDALNYSITLSFLLLLPVVVSIIVSPDFLVDHLTFRGIPLIFHKSDLIASSLSAGFFWLWTRWEKSGRRPWLAAAGTSLVLIGAMSSPRAGMFSVGVTTALWLLTGRWRIAVAEACFVATALAVAVAAIVLTGRDLKTSAPYSVYEHAVSIFDPTGAGTYINGDSGDPGGNNRFRLIWWRDVIEDTMATSPVLGLGFGSDLSTRFLADYDLLSDENFAARSPHSIIVTVFGRMGLVGLAAWLAVTASMAALVWKLLRRGEPDGMGLACIAISVFLSACFGVVLEGPMGATVFWITLGMASAAARTERPSGPASPQTHCTSTASGEWPVANGASLGSESAAR